MKVLKVIYLISSIDKGGAETHLVTLAENIKKKNHKVLLIYFKGHGFWSKYLKKNGIQVLKIKTVNIFSFFFNFFKLKKIVKNYSPDILHCNLSLAEIYGYLIKKFTKLNFKLIITKHLDSFYFEASNGKKSIFNGLFLEKLILKNAYKIIFISKAVKKYFCKKIKLGERQSCIIYYGLNKKFYKKTSVDDVIELKEKFKIVKKDLIIGCVARHVRQKSLDFLIRSFCVSSIKNKNLKLILVGTGPLTNELKKIAETLNLGSRIVWIKHFQDISKIISIFDISTLTSQYEGLGLFLLESMLLKKPIIATSRGAIPEVVIDNFNGYLLKSNDLNLFDKCIEKFKNKRVRKKFGNEGYKLFLKKFSLKKMTKSFLNIYEK